MRLNPIDRLGPAVLCTFLFSGCATERASVKEIEQDNNAYLAKEFSPERLPSNVLEQIRREDRGAGSDGCMLFLGAVRTETSGAIRDSGVGDVFVSAGNGIFQTIHFLGGYSSLSSRSFELTYRGLVVLKKQEVLPDEVYARTATQLKKITRFDQISANPQENSDHTFETLTAAAGSPLARSATKCRSAVYYDANTLHPKLEGRAMDFQCEDHVDGLLQSKRKYVFFEKYGVMYPIEAFSAGAKQFVKINYFEAHSDACKSISRMVGEIAMVCGAEMRTLGNLGSLRSALSIYYGDAEGKYPTDLKQLVPRYLPEVPMAFFPSHHDASNQVHNLQSLEPNDEGGWGYVTNPNDKDFGMVFPNCKHNNITINGYQKKMAPWKTW